LLKTNFLFFSVWNGNVTDW